MKYYTYHACTCCEFYAYGKCSKGLKIEMLEPNSRRRFRSENNQYIECEYKKITLSSSDLIDRYEAMLFYTGKGLYEGYNNYHDTLDYTVYIEDCIKNDRSICPRDKARYYDFYIESYEYYKNIQPYLDNEDTE